MSFSPEIRKIPEIIGRFNRAGLTGDLIHSLIKGETGRDLTNDARRLMAEYKKTGLVNVEGIDNFPKDSGVLIVFNHPNMDVLLPAMLTLAVKLDDRCGCVPMILMGSEIPLFGKFNETYPLPGSLGLMKRFQQMYSDNIVPVPMSTVRKDYHNGRFLAARKAVVALRNGNMVMVAPEGHVEMDNTVSPIDTLHSGSGGLSIIASRFGVPTVPVGIWETEKNGSIQMNVGVPFKVSINDNEAVGRELMFRVAQLMPQELRGPYKR